MAKRNLTIAEFDASQVCKARKAIVHGVVTRLSPVKNSKRDEKVKYFDGQIADDKGSVRLVSFSPGLRQAMHDSLTKKQPISLVDCEVMEARGGSSEVRINNYTKIESSPKKFPSLAVGSTKPDEVLLEDVDSLTVDQLVTVMVKANVVDAPETVTNRDGKELQKQDCIVADSSGNCRVVLWEQGVGKIEEKRSYKLVAVKVRSYKGANYLSLTSESEITAVEDIGDTAEMMEEDLTEKGIVKKEIDVEIDAVTYSDIYDSCVKCSAKVTSKDDGIGIAECTRRGTVMKTAKCKKCSTAKVSVTATNGKTYSLTPFNDVIAKIVGMVVMYTGLSLQHQT